jgi:hypothetical protein
MKQSGARKSDSAALVQAESAPTPSRGPCSSRVPLAGGDTAILQCHSTLPLTVIDCDSLGIHTVVLLSLLSFSVEMTALPAARRHVPV